MTLPPLGAFVEGPPVELPPTGSGPLDGLTFAVKDLIDVAGTVTGAGNPDWGAAQRPSPVSSPVVDRLLAAGARLFGKTITDELAFSLEGSNAHYGTPLNPRAPDRLPGGSSSGSAAAVAAGVVDFALGTDTGGSVRVPAAFCGLYAIRPTHDRISLEGVVPFAPSYDTIGVLARDPVVLLRVGQVALPHVRPIESPRYLLAEDAFAVADSAVAQALMERIPEAMKSAAPIRIFEGREPDWREAYRVLQGAEIWHNLGGWIGRERPTFGPSIAPRFADAATIRTEDAERWKAWRSTVRDRLVDLIGDDGILILPTAPTIAPLLSATSDEIGRFYQAALTLTSIAGHSGLPQVTVPRGCVDGAPVGISMIGPAATDLDLLDLAASAFGTLDAADPSDRPVG